MKSEKNKVKKIAKKGYFTEAELNEIKQGMERNGFKDFFPFVMHMVSALQNPSIAESRLRQCVRYQSSELFSCYNQIKTGIEVERNLDRAVKVVKVLCQELA